MSDTALPGKASATVGSRYEVQETMRTNAAEELIFTPDESRDDEDTRSGILTLKTYKASPEDFVDYREYRSRRGL